MTIVIVDYKCGNIHSVYKAVTKVSSRNVKVSDNIADLRTASHIILPGVGSFGYCRDNINAELADELVRQALTVGKKFLGICVGMQLLTKGSTEYDQGSTGLNIFPQLEVTKLSDQNGNLVIPHMGWNNIRVVQHDHPVLSGIDNKYMYFVHSYAIKIANSDFLDIACYCDYGERFAAVIAKDNIIATQFHPEKSGNNGLKLLDQFLLW